MAKLTLTQESLIRRGLATPEDFGVTTEAAVQAPTISGLTPSQQSLVKRGLATPKDFLDPEPRPYDDSADKARLAAYEADAAKWRDEAPSMGVLEFISNLPVAALAGRRAADTSADESLRNLVGTNGTALNSTSRAGMLANTAGGVLDYLTNDKSLSTSITESLTTNAQEQMRLEAARNKAREQANALGNRNTFLRTVSDASGSAPESVLSTLSGIGGAVAGGLLGGTSAAPTVVGAPIAAAAGAVVGRTVGSALGSIPAAQNAFYASWREAFDAAKAAGFDDIAAKDLADEQGLEQAAVEFGVEAVTGAIPGLSVGGNAIKRFLAKSAGRVAIEAGSEGVTPYAQNAARTASLALEGDESKREVIGGMIKDWTGPELREESWRGILAGGLTSGIMVTPATALEVRQEVRTEQRRSLDQKLADQAKADAAAAAAKAGTPTATRLAETFAAGVDNAPTAPAIEVDQLDVANESFSDTRFDRATSTIDTKLAELDAAAARVVDQSQPLRRQREESKANVAEIEQLRTFVETAAQANRPLTRDEKRKVGESIDRLNFLQQQQEGRAAAPQAKDIRSRLANSPDSELLTVAGELGPAQNFTNLTGPDLSKLSVPKVTTAKQEALPRAAANSPVSPEVVDLQQGMAEGRKLAEKEAAAKAAEPEKLLLEQSAKRREFAREYVRNNPQATEQEVMQAATTWQETQAKLAATPVDTGEASLATRASTIIGNRRKAADKKQTAAQAKVELAAINNLISQGVTDPQQIARILTETPPTVNTGATTTTAEATKVPENLEFDPNELLGRGTPVPPKTGPRAAMDPELAALEASFDANAAATPDRQVADVPIQEAVLSGNPLRKASVESGSRGVMNIVAEKATKQGDSIVAAVAERLGPLLEMVGVSWEFPETSISTANGPAAGMYIPGENKIQIGPEMTSDKNIVEIAAHEGLHAILQSVYKDASKFANGTKAKALIDQAIKRLQEAKASGELDRVIAGLTLGTDRVNARDLLANVDGLIFNADGTIEPDEFIAYGMTSPSIRRVFQKIGMKDGTNKSIWTKFKDAARTLLNIKESDNDSVLDRLMAGTEGLISEAESNPSQLKASVTANQREAVAGALNDRAAMQPKPGVTVSTVARLTQSREDSQGPRKAKASTASSILPASISRLIKKAFFQNSASVPGYMRASVTSMKSLVDAETARELALANKMDKLISEVEFGGMSQTAKRNSFSEQMNELNDVKEKLQRTTDQAKKAELQAQLDTLLDDAKETWGPVFDVQQELRAEVDRMSLELIRVIWDNVRIGADGKPKPTPEEVRKLNALKANLGTYITRGYAVNIEAQRKALIESYQDPKNRPAQAILQAFRDWAKTNAVGIPDDKTLVKMTTDRLRELAILWDGTLIDESKQGLLEGLVAVRDDPKRYTDEMLDKFVQNEINEILEGRGGVTTKRYVSERADESILKKRENVPMALRALMGESQDMPLRMLNTLYKQRSLLETYKMFDNIYKNMKGVHVFDDQATAPANYVQMVGESFGALEGKWVHPDVKAMLGTQEQIRSDIGEAIADPEQAAIAVRQALDVFNRYTKAAMLIPSALAYTANLLGSAKVLVSTGSYKSLQTIPGTLRDAIIESPGIWAKTEIPERLLNIMRQGLLDSALVGEITQESFKRAVTLLRPNETSAVGRVVETSGDLFRGLFDLYAGMDLWVKFQVYYSELTTLEELNSALPEDRKMSKTELELAAAEKTRETTFSYERAWPIANAAERVAAALFMRYTAETARTSANNVVMAKREFDLAKEFEEEGLPEAASVMRKRATARTIGQAAAIGIAATIEIPIITGALGMVAAMMGAGLSDEDDEDEELRDDLVEVYKEDASWAAGKAVNVVGKTEKGYVLMDAGRFDPNGPINEPIRNLAQGDPEAAAKSLVNSVTGGSPILGFITNADEARSRKPRLFREEGYIRTAALSLGVEDKSLPKAAMNLAEILMPNQLEAALTSSDESTLESVFGMRPQVMLPERYLGSFTLAERIKEARSQARGYVAVGNAVESIAAEATQVDIDINQSLQRRIRIARTQGLDDATISGLLNTGGMRLSKESVKEIIKGNFYPIILSDSVLNEAKATALEGVKDDPVATAEMRARFRNLNTELATLRQSVGSKE